MKHFTINNSKNVISRVCIIALWLLLWQGAYFAVGQNLLLPSPIATFYRMTELSVTPEFWRIILHSVSRIFLGYLLGIIFGTAIAILTAYSAFLNDFFSLPMNLIRTTPVTSFIILALVWISGKNLSIFISFLMVLPLVWSNVHNGFLSVDKKLLEMAHVYKVSSLDILKQVKLPAVMPFFISAIKVSLGFAWKSGIAGEVIAIPKNAIGTQIYNAKIYLETVDLFAWTGFIILLSLIIERLMVYFINVLFPISKENAR